MTQASALPEMLQVHPVAALFPLIDGADYDALVADIKANGLNNEIWLHSSGTILDGRNRYTACRDAGVEPRFKPFTGPDEGIVQFVTSQNLRRRHMTEAQRAFIAAELANMTREDTLVPNARDKKAAGVLDSSESEIQSMPLVSRAEAASTMQVKPAALDRARAVAQHAPDLKPKVISGEMSLTAAATEAAQRRAPESRNEGDDTRNGRLGVKESTKRAKDVLRTKREAERLHLIGTAKRKLVAWLAQFESSSDVRAAAHLVRQAVALLERE